jgi:predicted metal-dependent hydrolase
VNIFRIGNIEIPYDVIINNRLKTIRLSISTEGMKISMPGRVDFNEVLKLLETKKNWIVKHHLEFEMIKSVVPERYWEGGDKILYKGKEYSVNIYDSKKKGADIIFDGNEFGVNVDRNLSGTDRKDAIDKAFRKLFIDMAKKIIYDKLQYYSKLIGVTYNDIRITEQKTRWGSCSKKRNLNFNWKIIMAPENVLDYVVIHELCHLIHLNHSKDFWNTVSSIIPDYSDRRKWLKNNGRKLEI